MRSDSQLAQTIPPKRQSSLFNVIRCGVVTQFKTWSAKTKVFITPVTDKAISTSIIKNIHGINTSIIYSQQISLH